MNNEKIIFWLWAGWVASYLQRSLSAHVNGGSRCHLWPLKTAIFCGQGLRRLTWWCVCQPTKQTDDSLLELETISILRKSRCHDNNRVGHECLCFSALQNEKRDLKKSQERTGNTVSNSSIWSSNYVYRHIYILINMYMHFRKISVSRSLDGRTCGSGSVPVIRLLDLFSSGICILVANNFRSGKFE